MHQCSSSPCPKRLHSWLKGSSTRSQHTIESIGFNSEILYLQGHHCLDFRRWVCHKETDEQIKSKDKTKFHATYASMKKGFDELQHLMQQLTSPYLEFWRARSGAEILPSAISNLSMNRRHPATA